MRRLRCILLLALLIVAVPGRAKNYYSSKGGAASGVYQTTYEHESGSNSSTVRVRAKVAGKAYAQSSAKTGKSPEPSVKPEMSHQPSVEAEKNPELSTEIKKSPKPSVEPQPEKSQQPSAEPQTIPEPYKEPQNSPEPFVEPKKTPEPSTEPKKTPEPSTEPKKTPEPSTEPKKSPKYSVEPEKTPEPTTEPKKSPKYSVEPEKSPKYSVEPEKSFEPSPDFEIPPYPVDFSTTASSLRTRIFQGDVEGAANVLQSSRVISLAAGMTCPYELKHLVYRSENRNADTDVTAAKAMAMSALQTSDAKKLADVAVLSFQSDCQCSLLTPAEADDLREHFAAIFADRKYMFEVVTADANKDLLTHGRKLLDRRSRTGDGRSPTNSFFCAFCWPDDMCEPCFWCPLPDTK